MTGLANRTHQSATFTITYLFRSTLSAWNRPEIIQEEWVGSRVERPREDLFHPRGVSRRAGRFGRAESLDDQAQEALLLGSQVKPGIVLATFQPRKVEAGASLLAVSRLVGVVRVF